MTDVFVEGRAESNDLVLPDAHLDDWIEGLPGSSATSFAGVANPFHWGLPQQGEHVVGGRRRIRCRYGLSGRGARSGSGGSCRRRGHDAGDARAIPHVRGGSRARQLEFREGLAESLPVPDGWADVVIPNGVINLVPDKVGAYREIARVLKAGGRVQVADICVERPVPEARHRPVDRVNRQCPAVCRVGDGDHRCRSDRCGVRTHRRHLRRRGR